MKLVIGISGKAQNGKDTTADFLVKRYGGIKVPLAELIKEQAAFLGWDGEKDSGGRTFLQKLSEPIKEYGNWLAYKYPNKYADFGKDNYYSASLYNKIINDKEHDIFYISDLRFKSEFNFFNSKNSDDFKFISVRVTRPHFDNGLTLDQKAHKSEIDLDDASFDYYIENCGTKEDLEKVIFLVLGGVFRG